MNQYLNIAIEAAIEAGNEIINVYNSSDFDIELKSDNSPLTRADIAAHKTIVARLEKTPYPILSEEGKDIEYSIRKNWETFWMVDPLDGTKEFIKRNDEFTVNIALIKNNTPILGVVYVPVSGILFFADKNGAFKSGKNIYSDKIKLPIEEQHDNYRVVGSRSHMSPDTEEYIKNIDSKGKPLEMVSKGSSLKICMVAEGKADIYPRLGPTMEWDTAAGHAIALFAGKKVTIYPTNAPLKYNKENLLNPYFIVS
ncbi:MAG: 3'(2'),5'-bisphosphate nucleotidase CysQ [Prolixibacteraceae bacterium]|nr:3'(2'),5'-bisphosphate nucleotidase CysQ [Prolixibacteraceae bacterium]